MSRRSSSASTSSSAASDHEVVERTRRAGRVVIDPNALEGDAYQGGQTAAGKFVLKRGTTGKFRFNLLASNGKMIATSEAYETKAAALRGIESVRSNAPKARLDDTTEKNGSSKPSKVTRALKRDWEQTKADLPGLRGKNLNQDVDDTLAQAAGERKG